MTFLNKHRIIFLCAVIIAVFRFGFVFTGKYKLLCALIGIAVSVAFFFLRKRKKNDVRTCFTVISSGLLVFSLSFLCSFLYVDRYIADFEKFTGLEKRVEAVCEKVIYEAVYGSSYEIKIINVGGKSINVGAILDTDFNLDLKESEKFEVNVTFIDSSENTSYDGELQNRIGDGRFLYVYASSDNADLTWLGTEKLSFAYLFRSINRRIEKVFYKNLSDKSAGLISALLLGNRQNLPDSVKRDFKRIGISHLLAVSGLHLSMISGAVYYILRYFSIRKKTVSITVIIISLAFMGITGFFPSVIRAAVMLSVSSLFGLLRIGISPLKSLFITVAGMVIINPCAVMDISLELSFLATLGILLLFPEIKRLLSKIKFRNPALNENKILKFIISVLKAVLISIGTSISAMIFTIPSSCGCFGAVSILSPVSTMIFTPLVSLIMISGMLITVFSPVVFLCPAISASAETMCGAALWLCGEMSKISGITVSLRYCFTGFIIVAFVASVIIMLPFKRIRLFTKVFLPFTLALVSFFVCVGIYETNESKNVHIEYLNNGKNDGFLVISDGKALICDISDGSFGISSDMLKMSSEKYFRTETDAYMLTHYHMRHVSTFIKLSSQNYIRKLYLPLPLNEKEEGIASQISEHARKKGCIVIYYERGNNAFLFGKSEIKVPVFGYIKRSTHPVLSLLLGTDEKKVFYAGGSVYEFSENGAPEILKDAEEKSSAMIFGVHGPVIKKVEKITGHGSIWFANESVSEFYEVPLDLGISETAIGISRNVSVKIPLAGVESSEK